MSSSSPQQTPAQAILEETDNECLIHLQGDWRLDVSIPSWDETLEQCKASTIRLTAEDLGTWDTALLLFLRHGQAWCLAKKKKFDTSSLPENVQKILQHTDAASHPQKTASQKRSFSFRSYIGTKTIELFTHFREATAFVGKCTIGIFQMLRGNRKFRWMDSFVEMQHCWASSLPIVSFISFLVGVILAFQAAIQLQRYGAAILVVDLVSLSVVREMGPMMAAIVVAGGTGAGFAAQLGNMKVNEEIDALETLGISPIQFLVLPRLLAITVMMPILAIYADVLGILGGMYISATMLNIPVVVYWNEMQNRVSFTDVASGVTKSFVFGIMIALAGCFAGIQCERNTAGVGSATSSAVVKSIMLIILSDAIFSVIYNALQI